MVGRADAELGARAMPLAGLKSPIPRAWLRQGTWGADGRRRMRGCKKTSTVRAMTGHCLLCLLAACAGAGADALRRPAIPMAARLSAEKVGDVETGSYSAGDNIAFSLESYGDKYLLRFDGNPGSLCAAGRPGGAGRAGAANMTPAPPRLRVSVWGGMTLYTDEAPGGLPATRTGDFAAPRAPAVSARRSGTPPCAMRPAIWPIPSMCSLRFTAVPSAAMRRAPQAFDALTNIDGRHRAHRRQPGRPRTPSPSGFRAVKLAEGDKPACRCRAGPCRWRSCRDAFGAPPDGLRQRAIAVALGKFLSVPELRTDSGAG